MKSPKNEKRARDPRPRSKREPLQKKTDRVFDSLAAAAAALNLDKQTLKRAKGAGCPAFVGSRVQEKVFLRWISDNPDKLAAPAGATLEDQKTGEQIRKLRIGNDLEDGKSILKATVEKLLHELFAGVRKIWP